MTNAPAAKTVHVRWLVWTPPWRRLWRAWWSNIPVPLELARRAELAAPNFLSLTLGAAASLLLLIGAIVLAIADALATVVALMASALGHLVLRRPFLVAADTANGQWRAWWVRGWRHAHGARRTILDLLSGTDLPELDIGPGQAVAGLLGEFQ